MNADYGHSFKENAIAFFFILLFVVILVYLGITGH